MGYVFMQNLKGKALHIARFVLLSSQFLCTLTHSPTATNDGAMIAPQQDHKIFKFLNSHRGDVKLVVQALSGKKKAGNDIEMGTDDKDN